MVLNKHTLTLFSFFFIICSQSLYAGEKSTGQPWEYRLGEGLRIADTELHIGGYLSIKNENDLDENDERLVFDDLSLFIFGNIGERWKFFSELEDADFLETDTDGKTRTKHHYELERFYMDYLSSDQLGIRIGKFLTPVGTWNEIHAEPLTWTVSRPLVTFITFPEFTSGLQLYGNMTVMDEDISYSLFMQNSESIDEETSFRDAVVLYGGRLRWLGSGGLEIGMPLVYYYEYEVGDRVYLTGLDFTYRNPRAEIRGEATYSRVDLKNDGWSKEYGYYLQGTFTLTERNFLVLRHEYLDGREHLGEFSAISIGGAYKHKPQIVFKAEYQIRDGDIVIEGINNSELFLMSFSVLF